MPFKSEAQRRFFHAAEARGEIKKGTSARWERETPKRKKLPEHVKAAFDERAELAAALRGDDDGAFIVSGPMALERAEKVAEIDKEALKAETIARAARARGVSPGQLRQYAKFRHESAVLGGQKGLGAMRKGSPPIEIAYTAAFRNRNNANGGAAYLENWIKNKPNAQRAMAKKAGLGKMANGDLPCTDGAEVAKAELAAMDPAERERYVADMSAQNHRLALAREMMARVAGVTKTAANPNVRFRPKSQAKPTSSGPEIVRVKQTHQRPAPAPAQPLSRPMTAKKKLKMTWRGLSKKSKAAIIASVIAAPVAAVGIERSTRPASYGK